MAKETMERTTVYLDANLKRRLAQTARHEGITEAALLRRALRTHLENQQQPAITPVGHSKDGGIAEDTDAALENLGFGDS